MTAEEQNREDTALRAKLASPFVLVTKGNDAALTREYSEGPKAAKGDTKMSAVDASMESTIIDLYHWRPVFAPSSRGPSLDSTLTHWIYIQGVRDSVDGQSWHTSLIWSTSSSSSTLVRTRSGSTYRLAGPPHMQNSFPDAVCDAFHDGFPRDWIKLMAQEARRQGYYTSLRKEGQQSSVLPDSQRSGSSKLEIADKNDSDIAERSRSVQSNLGAMSQNDQLQNVLLSQGLFSSPRSLTESDDTPIDTISQSLTTSEDTQMLAESKSAMFEVHAGKGAIASEGEEMLDKQRTPDCQEKGMGVPTSTLKEELISNQSAAAHSSKPENGPLDNADQKSTKNPKKRAKSNNLLKELAGLRTSKLGILAVVDVAIQESICWDPEEEEEEGTRKMERETKRMHTRSRSSVNALTPLGSARDAVEEMMGVVESEADKVMARSLRSSKRKASTDIGIGDRTETSLLRRSARGNGQASSDACDENQISYSPASRQRRRSKRVGKWWQVSDEQQLSVLESEHKSGCEITAALTADQEAARALADLATGERNAAALLSRQEEFDCGIGHLQTHQKPASKVGATETQHEAHTVDIAERSEVGPGISTEEGAAALQDNGFARCASHPSPPPDCSAEMSAKDRPETSDEKNQTDTEARESGAGYSSDSPLSSPPSSAIPSPETEKYPIIGTGTKSNEEFSKLLQSTLASNFSSSKSTERSSELVNPLSSLSSGQNNSESSDFDISDYVAIASDEEDSVAGYISACKRSRFRQAHPFSITR